MIRSEIRQRIWDGLNDAAGVFLTTAHANAAIDEALEVLAEESGAIKRTAFVPQQPGTVYYWTSAIAPDVMAVTRVWDHANSQRLRVASMRELDDRHERWPTVTGPRPEVWFPISWDCFGVWPGSTSGGGVFRVDYLAWPRALLDDSDEPEFPLSDHDALVSYGHYDGLARRWDVRPMLEQWSLVQARLGVGRGRTTRQMQARQGRTQQSEQGGFTTGVLP